MSNFEWFAVSDISEFTDKVREIVYLNFGAWEKEENINTSVDQLNDKDQSELDSILSHQESLVIVKENLKRQKNSKTKKIRYALNEKIFADIIAKLNERMISNLLNSLVQKGLVETAFDSESNDFIFWCKKDVDKNKQKPETD